MNELLKFNSALGNLTSKPLSGDEYTDLVTRGRILALEKAGREKNRALAAAGKPTEDFAFACNSAKAFEEQCREWTDDVLYFAASKANSVVGKSTDRKNRSTFANMSLATDPIFLKVMATIIGATYYPVTPALISPLVGEMVSVETTPKGKTKTINVTSNAVFQYRDTSWTALRSVPQDQLYGNTITLNPKPFATRGVINFYQMIGNEGNLVDTVAAMAGGYAAYIMQKFTTAFVEVAGNTKYVPSALKATSYTSNNWATVCQNVAKANRVRRDQLIAYGDFMALRNVIPDTTGLANAIMYQLGDQYFRNGYITSKDGVLLYEIQPTSTPETINTTLTSIFPTDMIIIAARANERYAPMVMCFEEGADTQITLTPGEDTIATGRIELLQVDSVDIAPVLASRIGIISGVTSA